VIQRRAALGIVFAVVVSMLAACGFQSPDVESTEHASIQGAQFSDGTMLVRDVFVTSTGVIGGAPAVHVVATFVNESPIADALTGVTASGEPATISGVGVRAVGAVANALVVPPHGIPVVVDVSPTTPNITLTGTTTPPPTGTFIPLTFTFESTVNPPSVVQAPVVPPGESTQPTKPVPTHQATVPSPVGVSAST
jgi:hypothetical protein